MEKEKFEFEKFYPLENLTKKLYMKYGEEIEKEEEARRNCCDAYAASKPIYNEMEEGKQAKIENIRREIREKIKEIQSDSARLELKKEEEKIEPEFIKKQFIQVLKEQGLSEDKAEKIYMTELKDIEHWRTYHKFFQKVLETEDKKLIEELCEYTRQAILGKV